MPDRGLPRNLKIILDTAVTNCTITNLSITVFKIRFNSIDNGGQSLNSMHGSFARKSPSKQMEIRKVTFFRTQGVVTGSQNMENISESIERPY